MAPHNLLIDGNSIAHASHNATKLTVGGMQVQAIFGVLKSLRALLEFTPGMPKPIILWDGSSNWRKDIYPEYKLNRVAKNAKEQASKDAYKAQMPFLEKALEYLGVMQLRSPLLEADDIAGHMVHHQAGATQITLVTGDQDWLQLVRPNVTWFDPIRDRRVSVANFYDFTGYANPRAFVQGKALHGDTGDNVPPVGGIGEKGAPLVLATFRDMDNFFSLTTTQVADKSKALRELHTPAGRAKYDLNMKLMDLSQARKPLPGEMIIKKNPADPDKFELLCKRLAFASILREMPRFLEAFNIKTAEPAPW